MLTMGRWAVWLGVLLTVFGLVAGFGFMFAGDDDLAMILLTAVPFGFVILFAGLVTHLLFAPRSR